MYKSVLSTFAAAMLLLPLVGGIPSAEAEAQPQDAQPVSYGMSETTPDRIVYIDALSPSSAQVLQASELVSARQSTPRSEVVRDINVTPDVIPAVGETVRVVYSNSISDVSRPTATCTESKSADKPAKDGNGVWAWVSFYRSTGCSGTETGIGLLDWALVVGWAEKNRVSFPIYADGSTSGWWTHWTCQNSNSTKWRAGAYMNGGTTYSPSATIACG